MINKNMFKNGLRGRSKQPPVQLSEELQKMVDDRMDEMMDAAKKARKDWITDAENLASEMEKFGKSLNDDDAMKMRELVDRFDWLMREGGYFPYKNAKPTEEIDDEIPW